MSESDIRLTLLNTLLTTPHRKLSAIYPIHKQMIEQDPRFYVQVAAWYADHGDVRDHKEMFVINLCLSHFEGHRDVGLALLRALPPYEIARVVDFIKGQEVTLPTPKEVSKQRGKKKAKASAEQKPEQEKKKQPPHKEKVGLFVNVPRSMRTEIERYLRERERDPHRLDSALLHGRAAMKRLYAGLHIQPSERSQAVLFANQPPEDSILYAVKQIAKAESPAEQARAIAEHRIPYRVAASLIREMTPMVLVALIDVMTPQEVINNMGSLKKHGAFENEDVKKLVQKKLEAARSDKRVSAYKAKVAIEAAGVSGELAEQLDEITETQVKAKGTIKRPTALLLDKSGSMQVALEVGRQLGAMISAICESDLFAYAFDSMPYPITVKGTSLADWEKALAGIHAGGSTSCGVALEWMRKKKQRVEQIIMVTDEGENHAPLFKDAYTAYAEELATRPDVIFVKVGQASKTLENACAQMGVSPSAFDFKGDYYALTNLIPLLTRPSMLELLMEIMEYELPKRKAS
ncbi:MAG TPA: hypothetical protein VFU69_19860 [Ktedonobacterales bacterium]|nr:hypothetical protein [Ktedonobacterales bacterium]